MNENFWNIFSKKTSGTYSQRKLPEHILNENFRSIFSTKTSGTYSRMKTSGSYLRSNEQFGNFFLNIYSLNIISNDAVCRKKTIQEGYWVLREQYTVGVLGIEGTIQ